MTNVILPSRAPYGSPAYSPNSRPVYYGGSTVSGATPYALSFATLGLTGVNGYVYDGLASRFWTDNAMMTLASASGTDTVAVVEDLSGNENHALQTLTANRPVYYSAGGVKSVLAGTVSGVRRFHKSTDNAPLTPFTSYYVFKKRSDVVADRMLFMFRTSGYSAYTFAEAPNASPVNIRQSGSAGSTSYVQGPAVGAAGVHRIYPNAGALTLSANGSVSFSGMSTATGSFPVAAADYPATVFGLDDNNYGTVEFVFGFCAFADIGADARAAIETYITDNLASWAGN